MEPVAFSWWVWLIIGFALMAGELMIQTGFFLFFFGAGAVVTAAAVLAGIPLQLPGQGLVFLLVSLAFVLVLRKPMMTKFHFRNHTHAVDSMTGQRAKALQTIAPQALGRVEMRGTSWQALNVGGEPIASGDLCHVEKSEGLTLHIKG